MAERNKRSSSSSSATANPSALKKLYNTLLVAGLDQTARLLEMQADPSLIQQEVQCERDEALMASLQEDPEVQDLLQCIKRPDHRMDVSQVSQRNDEAPADSSDVSSPTPDLASQVETDSVFQTISTPFPDEELSVAWYFAYGSNMSEEQAKVRLGKTYGRELLHLEGYRLVFNKSSPNNKPGIVYANVEQVTQQRGEVEMGEDKKRSSGDDSEITEKCDNEQRSDHFGEEVYGIGYLLTPDQLLRMDHYEGVHFGQYRRERVRCAIRSGPNKGQVVTAFIYLAIGTVDISTNSSLPFGASNDLNGTDITTIDTHGNETINPLPSAEYLSRLTEGSDLLPEAYAQWLARHPTSRLRSPRQDMRLRKEL